MGFRTMQRLLLAKEEDTYGSDSSPTVGSNAIDVIDPNANYRSDKLTNDVVRASLGPREPRTGKHWIEVTFTTELKGSGTAGTAPALGDLFEACGYAESIGADGGSSSVVYEPASTGQKSITIYLYDIQTDGSSNSRLHKITGARGSWRLTAEAGQKALIEWTFQGKYNVPEDVATPGSATFEDTKAPIVNSANLTLNSVSTLIAQSLELDAGVPVSQRDDINDSTGLKGFDLGKRTPSGSLDPESVLLATYDFWSDWVGATARELSMQIGSSEGNRIDLTLPKLTIDQLNDENRNARHVYEFPFQPSEDSGDDEIKLEFK